MKRCSPFCLPTVCFLSFLLLPAGHAAISPQDYFRLGENDANAASGGVVTNATRSSTSSFQLNPHGSPRYTNDVSAGAALHTASSLAIHFNGSGQFLSNAVLTVATDDFGVEAWVKPRTATGNHSILRNGNNSAGNGWGIIQDDNLFTVEFGTEAKFGSGPVTANAWTHVALVRSGGTATLYVNGVAMGTSTNAPLTPTSSFTIGAYPSGANYFNGMIDEVRWFTLAAGQFSTNDLLLNANPPVPLLTAQAVTNILSQSATFNATVNPNGGFTHVYVQFGADTNYGSFSATNTFPATNGSFALSISLDGLTPGTTYHARVVAANAAGNTNSLDQVFTTTSITVTTLADNGPGSLRAALEKSLAGDTIIFLTNGIIPLTSGELAVPHGVTIFGPGASSLTINGNNAGRVFNIASNTTVNISGLTIRNGHAASGAAAGEAGENGGGIYNAGTLILSSCVLKTNSAGSGAAPFSGDGGNGGSGGGIYNLGSLTLNDCALNGNAGGNGGQPMSFGGAGGKAGVGGAIYNGGSVVAGNCTFNGNRAGNGGSGSNGTQPGGRGGGVYSIGSMMLSNSVLNANSAGSGGLGNSGGNGGGIFSSNVLVLNNCTISSNRAGFGGGGPSVGSPGHGGGIYNLNLLTLTNCTISANIAPDGPSAFMGAPGGSGGGIFNLGTLTLVSVTLSGNAAGQGGTSDFGSHGTSGRGGGIYSISGSHFLRNTILAGNTSPTNVAPNLYGNFTAAYALLGVLDTNAVVSFSGPALIGYDPMLAPLADYGGLTPTHALLADSPALDAGDNTLTNTTPTDQRGYARKASAQVDIGAFENQPASLPLRIVNIARIGSETIQLTSTNTPGAVIRVLASTNAGLPVIDWTDLGPASQPIPGEFRFTDSAVTNNPQRFFLLRSP